MNAPVLHGMRVLVTRPDPAGSELCAAISACGGHADHLPAIAFAPPPDQQSFSAGLASLGDQDWIIFISPNAVYALVPHLRRAWPNLPPKVKFAAVGAGTAKALKHAGYEAVHPTDDWSSDGLIAMPVFQRVQGQSCLIVRGEGGRETLMQTLSARGAHVSSLIAYQRVLPDVDVSPYLAKLAVHQIDIVVCTSYDSVKNLKLLLGERGWPYLRSVPLMVVSERIKSLAQDLGFQTICLASNASHEGILTALQSIEGKSHVRRKN